MSLAERINNYHGSEVVSPSTPPVTSSPYTGKKFTNADGSTSTPLPNRKQAEKTRNMNTWYLIHTVDALAPANVPKGIYDQAYSLDMSVRTVDLSKVTFEPSNLEVGIVNMTLGAPYAHSSFADSVGVVTVDVAVLANGKPCYNEDGDIAKLSKTFAIFPDKFAKTPLVKIARLLVPSYQKKTGKAVVTKADGAPLTRLRKIKNADGTYSDAAVPVPVETSVYQDGTAQVFALPITIQGYAQIYSYVQSAYLHM